MNNFLKTAHEAGVSQALQDFGITKEATKLLQTIEQLGISGGKKGLMDHIGANPRFLRGGSGKFKSESTEQALLRDFLLSRGQSKNIGLGLENRLLEQFPHRLPPGHL